MSPRRVRYAVLLTAGAEHDLRSIHAYIAQHDSETAANRVLDRILELTERLSTFPERGSQPSELRGLGFRDYRKVGFKPYRLVYRILDERVVIYLIADGRRDMQSLLARRLLDY